MKPKTKQTLDDAWSLLYVLEGEPFGCSHTLENLKHIIKGKILRVENIDAFKNACTQFNFGKCSDIVLVQSPKSEMLSAVLEVIQSGNIRCEAIVMYYPDAYADKRGSLIAEAHKRKRVYTSAYYLVSDTDYFKDYLKDWEERSGVQIAVKVKPWLIAHAPVKKVDVRGAKGAREEIVYDMASIESDLNKLANWVLVEDRDILSVDDLKMGIYQSYVDNQWDYCDAFIVGDESILNMELPEQNYVALARILVSQCNFACQVKAYGDKAINNADDISQYIGGANTAAKYTFMNGTSEGYKKTHPFRVKTTAKKLKQVSMERIISLISLCNQATLDMLNGHNHKLVYEMLILSSLNQMNYCKFSK